MANGEDEPGKVWRAFTDADRQPALPAGDENAHAVILHDLVLLDDGGFSRKDPGMGDMTLDDAVPDRYARVRRYRAFLARDQAGVEAFGAIHLPHESYEELVEARARVTKPDGRVIVLADGDFHRKRVVTSWGFEAERLVMVIPDLAPGDIVDYLYETRSEFAFQPPAVALQDTYPILYMSVVWRFREPIPSSPDIDLSAYRYTADFNVLNKDTRVASALVGDPPGQPTRFRMTARMVPGSHAEPDAPSVWLRIPLFVPWYKWTRMEEGGGFWKRAAALAWEETEDFLQQRGDLDRWMGPILARSRNESEDLKTCLAMIHRRFHPSEPGEASRFDGTRENRSVADVLEHGTRSGADLDMVLLAMLRRLGYGASLSLCSVVRRGRVMEDWHSLSQFDYQMVALNGSSGCRFVFPALRGSTVESLPYEIAGGRALLLGEEDGGRPLFHDIPRIRASENLVEVRGKLDLSRDRELGTFQMTWECAGESFLRHRILRETAEEARAILRERALPSWGRNDVRGEKVSVGDRRFSYACSLNAARLVERAEEMCIVDMALLAPEFREYGAATRRSPLDLGCPRTVSSTIEIIPPPGTRVEGTLPFGRLTESFGEFEVRATDAGGSLVWRANIQLSDPWIEPDTYALVRRFLQRYVESVSTKLVFASIGDEN